MTALYFRSALLLAFGLVVSACGDDDRKAARIETAAVERRTITVDAQANGVIEPINVVEIKSKASGIITRMSVETGDPVRPGDLLAQIDTRDVQNQYNQAEADLEAANARLQVAVAQKRRSDEMFAQRVITAQEHETAALDYANAQAQLVRARASLDLAKQRLEDATVSAPVAGTIIERTVSLGQVITSATGSSGAGTTLLKMADLDRVRVRALFNETDIGTVRSAQGATVVVDAYPDRRFTGLVEKIEPQAVVQQGVTMFPVLVTLDNREGLLKPGMNGEVSVLIDERANVVAVPNDAIRNVREAAVTAPLLGLDADSVQAQVAAQMGGGLGRAREVTTARGDIDVAQAGAEQDPARRASGQRRPGAGVPGDSTRVGRMRGDSTRFGGMRGDSIRAGGMRGDAIRRGAPGGAPGGARGDVVVGGRQLQGPGEMGAPRQRTRPGLVFVAEGGTYVPRIVRLGAGNFDYTEVVSGLKEGEEVVLLAALTLQAQRSQQQDQIRSRMGGGVPGMQQQGGGGGGAGGGARRPAP